MRTDAWKACRVMMLTAGALFLTTSAYPFGNPIEEVPYVTLWPAYTAGTRHVQASLQHFFYKGYIQSANFRLGYPLSERFRVYAGYFYHGNIESQIRMGEPEVKFYWSPLRQKDEKPLSLSLAVGASYPRLGDYFSTIRGTFKDRKAFLSAELPVTRKFGDGFDFTLSPVLLADDGDYIDGVMGGGRYTPFAKFAVIVEGSVLFSNPYDYRTPWGLGLQYQIGPHTVTGFFTNTDGITLSNLMRGTGEHYAGFRFDY